ncbi:flocculation protein FLO11 isoform X2 [Arachis duranensis]|uniref:Flocculation protein FLO11 isoform X2 n=1 Tax=Arachis duranensis TaxID=130453 RepID=A0A9C6WUQ5_ARADU|nr:flocculation protein FLO11 isoform X2 [Arachis duranensis]
MVMKERDEELALFLEMRRKEKENEKNNLLFLQDSEELDLSNLESNRENSTISKIVSSVPPRKTGVEEFLNSENDKSDYDWLLSSPDAPLFPTLEKEPHMSVKSEAEIHKTHPTALKPRVSNIQVEPSSRTKSIIVTKNNVTMPGHGSSTTSNKKPSSSGPPSSASSRSSTPSGRSTLPSSTKTSRPSTPAAPSLRSSTPTTQSTSKGSTPTSRSSSTAPKASQRSATPNLRSSTPSRILGVSAPLTRPSSASKARPAAAKNPAQSRGISPSVKSRPWEPSQMPGFSLDAPPNLKTSLPERPASVTRSRPGAPSRPPSSSGEATSNEKPRRQSSAPSKGRPSTGSAYSGQTSLHALSGARFTDGDEDSPVVIGTKMVERVVNMRKLAPPKHVDHHSANNNSNGKSSSGSSGFGTTLSKKSLDMAMRHMFLFFLAGYKTKLSGKYTATRDKHSSLFHVQREIRWFLEEQGSWCF